MHDRGLTSMASRKNLAKNEGKISVSLRVGDEIGDVQLGVLYVGYVDEGHKELELNMLQQNDLMTHVNEWMADILGGMGVDFEATLQGETPGSSPRPLALMETAARLESSLTPSVQAPVEVARKVQIES